MTTSHRAALRASATVSAVILATLVLAGCAPTSMDTPTTAPGTPSNKATDTEDPVLSSTPIVLVIAGREIPGALDDNPTSASLIAQLPVTLEFRDYGGQEKIAELPAALDLAGAPERSGAEPLSIGYYSPDQALVLYYEQVGASPGIVPLGSFDDLEAIKNQSADFSMVIRLAG